MNVIGIVGSPRPEGNTKRLVARILAGAAEKGATTKLFNVAQMNVKGCTSCWYCRAHDTCSIRDDMQGLYPELHNADAIVVGSPVYMFQMTAQTKAFVDRLFALINPDFSTRLKKKPRIVLAFTQGEPNTQAFADYFANTGRFFQFLGGDVRDTIVAGGTRELNDIESQKDLLARALTIGHSLATA